jgi:hypothetical protein
VYKNIYIAYKQSDGAPTSLRPKKVVAHEKNNVFEVVLSGRDEYPLEGFIFIDEQDNWHACSTSKNTA